MRKTPRREWPRSGQRNGTSVPLHQRAVTMLELLARPAGTSGVAAYFAPGRRIVGIDRFRSFADAHTARRQRLGTRHLVFAGQRVDMVRFHSGKLLLLDRWRLAHANLHMHELAHD